MQRLQGKTGALFIFLMTVIACTAIFLCSHEITVKASAKNIETPQNLVVQRYRNRALKLQWKEVKKADGYRVYRYSKKSKKYVKIKTIYHRQKTKWIDQGLKLHKQYKYKVAAFKKVNGRKKFSKKTYTVMAGTYGKKGKRVNAESAHIISDSEEPMGICSQRHLSAMIDTDSYTIRRKAKLISEKVTWSSSNPKIASVNQQGDVTAFDKEGSCYIYLRTHNGITGKIQIKVVNYARPEGFTNYNSANGYVHIMLRDYQTEICNIATYFTKLSQNHINGVMTISEGGNLTGLPNLDNISEIKTDVEKLLKNFPLVTEIYYSKKYVRFKMKFDTDEDSYCEVVYAAEYDFEEMSIAPHWYQKQFAPM